MFINNKEILELLSMSECIEIMEKLFLLDIEKDVVNLLRSKMLLDNNAINILGMMPAYIKPYRVMGVKVLSVFSNNYKQGLSSYQGVLHLFETNTGKLICSLDVEEITAIRTAAVSALVTDKLAISDAHNLCLIGSGVQAKKHLEAMLKIRDIQHVSVWSKNEQNAINFIEQARSKYELDFQICNDVATAAKDADIICTITASPIPILKNDYLQKHVHINAIGACTTNARELSTDIITTASIYVDSKIAVVNETGDLLIPATELECNADNLIKAEISEILKDNTLYNSNDKTVFKSVGLAIEDVAAGLFCYHKYKEHSFCINSCN